MKLPRPKKLVFCNNKGGVGKTTLAFNCATKFAQQGYKTVLIDLDPQCNLSLLGLGYSRFTENLFSLDKSDIYAVLKGVIEGGGDVDLDVQFVPLAQENLFLLPGSLKLSLFENTLMSAYSQATASEPLGYFQTSAIDRYLRAKGLDESVDIFVIDTSPNLGILNRIIFLGADYFVVPMMPDGFSVQGIENLGSIFEEWKRKWKLTALALAGNIPQQNVLMADALFIGYIVNSYNVYGQKPIKQHQSWIEEIPLKVKKYLSEKHGRNGLVEQSWKVPLQTIQDYGQLTALCQEKNKAIFDLDDAEIAKLKQGTKENLEKSRQEFDSLARRILGILEGY